MGRFALPDERPDGLDSPMTAKIIKYGAKAQVRSSSDQRPHRQQLAHRRGISQAGADAAPRARGPQSGTTFTTPVLYLADGRNLVVVASQGGLPKNPQWFPNLQAQPETVVHLRQEGVRRVRARVAEGEERAALWPRLVDLYADFAKYAHWTDRRSRWSCSSHAERTAPPSHRRLAGPVGDRHLATDDGDRQPAVVALLEVEAVAALLHLREHQRGQLPALDRSVDHGHVGVMPVMVRARGPGGRGPAGSRPRRPPCRRAWRPRPRRPRRRCRAAPTPARRTGSPPPPACS